MSSRTFERTVRIRALDETTPVLLGITRTMGGMRREITALRTMLKLLAADELISADAAESLGTALAFAIPVIGIAAGLIQMVVGATLAQRKSAIPIGQTTPGRTRTVEATGTALLHRGETVGRLSAPKSGGGGGGAFNVQVQNLTLARDGEDAESVGRTFAHIRAAVLSTDVPASAMLPLVVGASSLFHSLQIQLWFGQLHIPLLVGIASIFGVCIWRGFHEYERNNIQYLMKRGK